MGNSESGWGETDVEKIEQTNVNLLNDLNYVNLICLK